MAIAQKSALHPLFVSYVTCSPEVDDQPGTVMILIDNECRTWLARCRDVWAGALMAGNDTGLASIEFRITNARWLRRFGLVPPVQSGFFAANAEMVNGMGDEYDGLMDERLVLSGSTVFLRCYDRHSQADFTSQPIELEDLLGVSVCGLGRLV